MNLCLILEENKEEKEDSCPDDLIIRMSYPNSGSCQGSRIKDIYSKRYYPSSKEFVFFMKVENFGSQKNDRNSSLVTNRFYKSNSFEEKDYLTQIKLAKVVFPSKKNMIKIKKNQKIEIHLKAEISDLNIEIENLLDSQTHPYLFYTYEISIIFLIIKFGYFSKIGWSHRSLLTFGYYLPTFEYLIGYITFQEAINIFYRFFYSPYKTDSLIIYLLLPVVLVSFFDINQFRQLFTSK